MNLLKLTLQNQSEVVEQAVVILRAGGVIVFPTETAYGLAADVLNSEAVGKVYRLKGRDFHKPLPVIAASLAMAKKYVEFDERALALAKKFWPGALTLVLEHKNRVGGLPLVFWERNLGIRVSDLELAREIARKLGRPITATSANLSGTEECYSIEEVMEQFKDQAHQPDLFIDAGRLAGDKPSTVADVTGDQIKILRQGKIYVD